MSKYKDAASFFISAAFDIINAWNAIAVVPNYGDTNISVSLTDLYELRINSKGRLYLIKYDDFDPKGFNIIGHGFGEKYSQITYVGKLLAVYLEHLQIDDE